MLGALVGVAPMGVHNGAHTLPVAVLLVVAHLEHGFLHVLCVRTAGWLTSRIARGEVGRTSEI